MRILYCIPSYAPGLLGNQIHAEVIAYWRAAGVESEVLTFAAGLRRPESPLIDGVRVHRLPLNRTPWEKAANRAAQPVVRYPYWLGALARLRRFMLAQGRRFDLLHIETAFPLAALAVLSGASLPPMAVTLQGADVMAEPEFDYGYARFAPVRALLRQVFRRAALLRADSPMIARLVADMGADPAKTISVPFNITDDRFPPPDRPLAELRRQARQAVCARHGLDPATPILLSINRLHPFKGIEFLVEALPLIQRAVGPVYLLIGGPNRATPRFGDYGAYLQRRAAELGVADRVRLLGRIEPTATPQYYAAADIAGVVSVAESLSRVAAEAGAMGTPTIVTRTTGISDYVAAYDAGQVVAPRSGAAVAEAAIRLLSDAALWQRQAANGPRLAAAFRSEVIARQLLDAYRPLVGAAAASGTT